MLSSRFSKRWQKSTDTFPADPEPCSPTTTTTTKQDMEARKRHCIWQLHAHVHGAARSVSVCAIILLQNKVHSSVQTTLHFPITPMVRTRTAYTPFFPGTNNHDDKHTAHVRVTMHKPVDLSFVRQQCQAPKKAHEMTNRVSNSETYTQIGTQRWVNLVRFIHFVQASNCSVASTRNTKK